MATVRVRKRGKTFSYVFEAGRTAAGKRKVVEKGGFSSREAAYEAGTAAFTDFTHGNIGIKSERVTVADYMALWLSRVKDSVRPSTYRMYGSTTNTAIVPLLGSIILQDLSPAMLDQWLRQLFQKGYARATLSRFKTTIHEALSFAVYPCQLISSNPSDYVKVPRNAPEHVIKRTIVTPEMYDRLLDLWPLGHKMHTPVIVLYNTGIRIGELAGLTWDDIDLEAGTLAVRRQIIDNRTVSPLKTKASYRTMYLSADFLSFLREEKARQLANEERLGDLYFIAEEDASHRLAVRSVSSPSVGMRLRLVCVDECGRPTLRNTIMWHFKSKGLNSHSFRHTQATRLAELGVSPVAAAARLGHAKPSMTLDVYSHNTDEAQKKIAAKLDDDFFDI